MCGICGYISRSQIEDKQLWDMTDSMSHRGPDDRGVWTCEDNGYHIGFGHRRLSILDLSELGHQPMSIDSGNITVTFNGEIYNFLDLRTELEKDGFKFLSNCDTEVLLYAYLKWGDDCVEKLNGMFAFAIYDKRNHRALFARDRAGKKPLYYYISDNTLIFGSEMKALMKHPGFKKDINKETIAAYMTDMCIIAPHTIFQNTYKLEPGHILIWENGEVKKKRYWDIRERYMHNRKSLVTNTDEAKEGLRGHIRESVKKRLVADVPVGLFLSGGIDSSLIAGIAAEVSDKPVKTFTIGLKDNERNEAERAKEISNHLKTNHTEHYITEEDILSLVGDIPKYYDEPFADSSQIPTMLVSKLAKQDVTVALSGDGGDELFYGYTKYDKKNIIRRLGSIEYAIRNINSSPGVSKLGAEDTWPKLIHTLLGGFTENIQGQLFDTVYKQVALSMVKDDVVSAFPGVNELPKNLNWREKLMLTDFMTSLPDDMLCKTDRASMRYGLELRCPLLDIDVIEFSLRIPEKYKLRGSEKKWVLKQLAYDYVPPKLLDMPKRGFSVPVTKWLRGPLKGMVGKYSDKAVLEKQGIFKHEPLMWLIDKVDHTDYMFHTVLWSFLMFQMWYAMYIEDLWG